MKLTDFLGNEYGPGDLVIYGAMSGRCVNMVIGRVDDIYKVYRDPDTYKWVRVPASGEVPLVKYGKDEGKPVETHTRVKVQPLRSSRWKQHHGKTRYIDTRTGKGINPDAPSGKHLLKESHYVYADGTEYPYEAEKVKWEAGQLGRFRTLTFSSEFRRRFHVNYGEPGTHRHALMDAERQQQQLWWVPRAYQPWVQKLENGPEPVTLEITDNIVRWEGELPDADV